MAVQLYTNTPVTNMDLCTPENCNNKYQWVEKPAR